MKKCNKVSIAIVAALGIVCANYATADPPLTAGQPTITTELTGYEETPSTLNSPASGEFSATIHRDGSAIDYVLTYRDFSTSVTQAHIHFGRPGLSGGIVLFLCTNLSPPSGPPTPPPCPTFSGTVTGTLTAANVIAVPGQGIDSGAAGFAEMLEAIRVGAAYANVHTTSHPGGEIRGRLDGRGPEEH